ncbi:hypothetical protein [Actibacterium sp.]|uniref:hypothetical protein n=1 Tax=Actibacterium sp. TaxID=1872125 RepID=UPI00356183BA
MSNPDSFIDEVTEEVRRDRLFALFRKYGWIAIVAVVLIVGGASYFEWQKAQQVAAAQALGDGMLAALSKDDAAARIAALDQVQTDSQARVLVELLAAGEATGPDAAARYQAIADDAGLPLAYRQLATIKMVVAQGKSTPPESRRAALGPLSAPGQPFRPAALEHLALIAVETGDNQQAIALLREAIQASDATAGLRQRASQLIVALGGSLEDLS